ncbi:protein MMS22-like [Copidosoma floridanum]|uniref:protein MMS22-like n=1 Tax=Copidosoma floridanum TaxID=29053 RepID=UPI0006C962D5|nr:protein MMS22-like [Copidosoma floridanum]
MPKGTFNCSGKVNINDWQLNNSSLLLQREVDNVLNGRRSHLNLNFNVFDCEQSGISILLNLKHFIRCMEAKMKQLGRHEKLATFGNKVVSSRETDFFSMREKICEFLFYLRDYLLRIKEENCTLKDVNEESEKLFEDLLNTIHRYGNRLRYIPDSTFLYATSNIGNKNNQPEYHMFHLHLDLRWLVISLVYTNYHSGNNSCSNFENLENCIYTTIGDLIYIALKIFATIPIEDLRLKTPYSCTCIRELWLMLQIFTDDIFAKSKSKIFWTYVNSILNQSFPNETNKNMPMFEKKIDLPHCKSPELFCLWFIYHLTLLYGYSENGNHYNSPSSRFAELQENDSISEVEKILKAYINKGGKNGARDEIDEELCIMIPMLHTLTCEWWKPRTQIITLLWDCFHKRLDQPFLMQTRGPWCTSSEKKTPMDIIIQVRNRLKNNFELANESSFGLFLRLLGMFLLKYYRNDTKILNQISGRLYSKFSPKKIQEFSESGLFNFVSLFLNLAVTSDMVNVCSRMLNLLPSLLEFDESTGDKKVRCLIWKSKLSVLLLFNEKKLSFKDIAESFTETVNAVSCRTDESSRSMMTWFIDVLRIILTQSEDFSRSEHVFLDGWIDRYLAESAPNRVGVLTSTLLMVFDKCKSFQNTMGCILMLDSLWKHVAIRIRLMVATCDLSNEFYKNPTKLAAAFTLDACRDPATAKKYCHSAISLFQHFTASPIIKDLRITRLYLTLVLENENAVLSLKRDISNFNICCIQAWVKCSMLNNENNDVSDFLNKYIVSLPEIREILSSDDVNNVLRSNEPIINFLLIIARKRNTLTIEHQRVAFDSLCKSFFHNVDKWSMLLNDVIMNEENKDSKLSVFIYRCIGTLILCCSPILYVKNQPNNTLRLLINRVALSQEQVAQQHTLRIFSMIILGIENLTIKSDISLQQLIRDLFERYLPLLILIDKSNGSFKVTDTLSKCFLDAQPDFVHFMLVTLTRNFIIIPGGNSTHKHCHLVMLLLRNLVRASKLYRINILESIITVCISSILNCYMRVHDHHPHRQQTLDLLRDVAVNTYYKESFKIREKMNDTVWSNLVKYVQTNSKISFDFLSCIQKINPELFRYLFPRFEQVVSECERNKLPNAAALRYAFSSLKRSTE